MPIRRIPRRTGLALVVAALAGAAALTFSSCASKPEIEITVLDGYGLRPDATYAQLAVFPDACPPLEQLRVGDLTGATTVQTIDPMDSFAALGDMSKGKYGFSVLLRLDDCGVLAYGCTEADFEVHRRVTIAVQEYPDKPAGACDASEGLVCVGGQCVEGEESDAGPKPDANEADASTPKICKLTTTAADVLPVPRSAGATFTGPDVVATPEGFVVGYREVDATGATAKGYRILVKNDGTASAPVAYDLHGCSGAPASSGLAMGWSDANHAGLMAVAMPACGEAGPSLHVTTFDAFGQPRSLDTYNTQDLRLSSVQAAAPYPDSTRIAMAAVANGQPTMYLFQDSRVFQDTEAIENGGQPATFAQVATGTGIVALAAAASVGGAGTSTISLSVRAPKSTNPSTVTLPGGTKAAVAAWNDRALLAVADTNSISWNAYDVDGYGVGNGGLAGSGSAFLGLDVAVMQPHVWVAGARPGTITLYRLDDINGSFESSTTYMANLKGTPDPSSDASLLDFDGKNVALAAGNNRAIVVWLTDEGPADDVQVPIGGYAVLTCDG